VVSGRPVVVKQGPRKLNRTRKCGRSRFDNQTVSSDDVASVHYKYTSATVVPVGCEEPGGGWKGGPK
jgi:hypothetical protein